MKDWKAECDKLRGELAEVRRHLEYYRQADIQRRREQEDIRNRFKELLIDVLGK